MADTQRPARVAVERTATSTWSGYCALNPHHDIQPGQTVAYTEHGWICHRCIDAVSPR